MVTYYDTGSYNRYLPLDIRQDTYYHTDIPHRSTPTRNKSLVYPLVYCLANRVYILHDSRICMYYILVQMA